jgi:hypothetical protein
VFVAALFPGCLAIQAQNPPQVGDSCQTTQTLAACQSLAKSGTANPAAGLYVALASSFTMGFAGLAHGQTSQSVAEQTALANCKSLGANDCKIQKSAQNSCVAMATYYAVFGMGTLINFGYGEGANRVGAASQALAACAKASGQNCNVRATSCSSDNPAFASPLPLPSGGKPGSVDPNLVGTWAIDISGATGGRWVWQISGNGTYEVHSEALDGAPSNAGTFSAKNGLYTLDATNFVWDDAGSYTFQAPGTLSASGKLGNGTWHKIAQESN